MQAYDKCFEHHVRFGPMDGIVNHLGFISILGILKIVVSSVSISVDMQKL